MKKKQLILVASLSMVAALGVAGGILASTANSAAAVKAEEEKTVEYVNITTQAAMNENNLYLNIDKSITGTGGNYVSNDKCYWRAANVSHNNKNYEMGLTVFESSPNQVLVGWGKTFPSGTGYHHWHMEAGTTLFETDTKKYVLEKDYNWWQARQSAGNDSATWVFQHGGESCDSSAANYEIPSFSLSESVDGGVQTGDLKRYLMTINYTKSSAWQSNNVYCANAYYYSMDDGGNYVLAYNGDTANHELVLANDGNSGLAASTDVKGSELFLFMFTGLDTTTGSDKFVSFYLPKGTLFGGFNEGYPCFLENDYYITFLNDHLVGGTTMSTQDLIYAPVKNFITSNMHMNDAAYDGTGTGACASIYSDVKTAYNTLTENQKYAFLNYSGYTDAKARLLSWAAANGDALDASNSIVAKKSSSLILNGSSNSSNVYALAICAGALALAAGGAFFVFKKKREN